MLANDSLGPMIERREGERVNKERMSTNRDEKNSSRRVGDGEVGGSGEAGRKQIRQKAEAFDDV